MASQEYKVVDSMSKSKADYILDSDEEAQRLSNQHEVIKDAMDGKLVYAPLDDAQALKILDSGTADGTWILDYNKTTAGKHTLVGTDILDKDFPKENRPSNVQFHVQDINKEWPSEYKESFDLVHQRLVIVGSGPNWQSSLEKLADMVKPGGWIQLIESENKTPNSPEEFPAMQDFMKLMTGIFTIMSAPLTLADDMPKWLQEHGFDKVQQKQLNLHMGNNNPKPELAKRGLYSNLVAANGLVQFAKTLPDPPLSKERLETFIPDFKKELSEKGVIFPLRLIWAQKL